MSASLFHVFACHVILMAMISSGAHVVFPPLKDIEEMEFLIIFEANRAMENNFCHNGSTAISALMQRPVDADISSVKTSFSGSAPLP